MEFSDFAEHLDSTSGIVRLMDDLGQAIAGQPDILMLGGGNPAMIPAMEQAFRDEMQALLDRGRRFEQLAGQYAPPQGSPAFIEALAKLLNDTFGWSVDCGNIAITNGSQSSFSLLFNLFAGRCGGRQKSILLPMLPEYIGYADLNPGRPRLLTANRPVIELDEDGFSFKYRVDFERLKLDSTVGAICISRPTNPTGNMITDAELAGLRRAAGAVGIPLIIDGAYGLPFPHIVFTEAQPVWDERIILCLSLSKLGLPGARTGIVVADRRVIEKIRNANAIFSLAPGNFGPGLTISLMQSGKLLSLCRRVIRPYYREKSRRARQYVQQTMTDLPLRVHHAEGTLFLWLWFQALPCSSEQLYRRLKQRGVIVVAGSHFFPGLTQPWSHASECIRVSYATDWQQFTAGIDRIAEQVRDMYAAPPGSTPEHG